MDFKNKCEGRFCKTQAAGRRGLLQYGFSGDALAISALLTAAIWMASGCDGSKSARTQPETASQPELATQTAPASQTASASQVAITTQPAPVATASRTAPASAEKPDVKPPPQTAAVKPPDAKPIGPERILSLDVQITIEPFGVLDITETYRVFSEGKIFKRGLTRELPRPPDDNPHKVPPQINLDIREASVDGKPAKWQIKNHGRFRWVFISGQDEDAALGNGEHVFAIKYRVEGQIAPDSRLEELVWTVTGNWSFAIDRLSVAARPPGRPASQPASAPIPHDDWPEEPAADESPVESAKTPATSSTAPAASSSATASGAAIATVARPPSQKKGPSLYEGKVVSGGKEKTFQPFVQADGNVLFNLSVPLKKGDWLVIVVRYPPPSSATAESPAPAK